MDPRFQTSFIPKKPIVATPGREPSSVNLFALLSTIVFIMTLALAGGVFSYKQLIVKQIAENKVMLDKAKSAFEPETIKSIVRLDTRLEVGKKLLDSHLAVTPFFEYLSTITLKTVRFKTFDFSYLSKDKIEVKMSGQAQDYDSVALQSDLLNQQKLLKKPMLGDMSLEAAGTVAFNMSALVDPTLISYNKVVGGTKTSTTTQP